MSNEYNEAGVQNTTPKDRQIIFMDARFNAQFDVNVLASAFNMDKADFMGRLFLIDNWTSFDNDRWDIIKANSTGVEDVTAAELSLLADVKAVIMDEEWFQVYDNNNKFTEDYVAAGLYWNYFYHVWKTVSSSPFANAVVFVEPSATITAPTTLTYKVSAVDLSNDGRVINLVEQTGDTLQPHNAEFIQTKALTEAGIAVHPYGSLVMASSVTGSKTIVARIGETEYSASVNVGTVATGATITLSQPSP